MKQKQENILQNNFDGAPEKNGGLKSVVRRSVIELRADEEGTADCLEITPPAKTRKIRGYTLRIKRQSGNPYPSPRRSRMQNEAFCQIFLNMKQIALFRNSQFTDKHRQNEQIEKTKGINAWCQQ